MNENSDLKEHKVRNPNFGEIYLKMRKTFKMYFKATILVKPKINQKQNKTKEAFNLEDFIALASQPISP